MKNHGSNWKKSLAAFCLMLAVFGMTLVAPKRVAAQKQPDGKGVGTGNVTKLPSKDKRYALIIGVDAYEDSNISPLRGASNDAKELAKALRFYAGFDETQMIVLTSDAPRERQPTRANILRRLSNLKLLVPKDGLSWCRSAVTASNATGGRF
jgi:hypothetical protein